MNPQHWVDEIRRIAAHPDENRIEAFANYLNEVGKAHAILRAKGYGTTGTSIVDVARDVPEHWTKTSGARYQPNEQVGEPLPPPQKP